MSEKKISIKLFCNWTSSYNLREEFKKYFKTNYSYDNLEFVLDNQDYDVVVETCIALCG
jgi:hypothetical protein